MDNFQNINSGQGMLKNDYDDTLSKVLKKKRRKLAETKRETENPLNEEEQVFENIKEDL